MRHFTPFVLLAALAGGCSKKNPPEPADPGGDPKAEPPADTVARDRAYWLNDLKSTDPKKRQNAADELSVWVETDPEAVNGLLEALKDRNTTGAGKIQTARINSTREAAAHALSRGGPKGEAALKEKGLALLRDGLNDPDAAIREHTAHTVGTLGPLARPLSADVMKLCTDAGAPVREAAFGALRLIGVTDPVGFVALLEHENPDVVRLAAALVPDLREVPAAAVPALAAALADKDAFIRTSVAAGLAKAGRHAAPAVGALVGAINATYPKEPRPKAAPPPAAEAYWRALAAVGEPAVDVTAGLLGHTNPVVRIHAARTLGRIGPPAKSVADKLRDALQDPVGEVAIEAACALCRAGEAKDEAVALVRRAIEEGEPPVARYAIEATPRLGEPGKALVPVALAKLADANAQVRLAAVELVDFLEPAEAAEHVAALAKLVTDRDAKVRFRVGQVLERLGPAAGGAAEALGKALPKEKENSVREQFVDALLAMGPKAKPATPALLARAKEASPQTDRRARLFHAVAALDPASREVAGVLLAALNETDASVRAAAAGAVARLDPMPPEALTRLVAIANTDRATSARLAALRALAAAGAKAKPVRADVEKIAGGKWPEFALLAKVALGSIDGDVGKAAPDVRAALGDKNSQVRSAAVESLLLVGPTAADLPVLLRVVREPGGAPKEAAAACLAKLGPAAKDAVPELVRLLDDREGNVRAAAATALGEIGLPAAQPAVEKLKKLRGDARSGDLQAGPAARRALEKLGAKEKE